MLLVPVVTLAMTTERFSWKMVRVMVKSNPLQSGVRISMIV